MVKKKKGWPVLAAGAAMLLFSGVPSAWGVFRKPAAEEYGFGDSQSAFVLNLTVAAFGVGCVLGGLLQDKKGPRAACLIGSGLLAAGFCAAAACPAGAMWLFYLGFCLPAGLGCAFLYPAVMSCVQQWYADKKGLATGAAGVGFGLSGLALTLIVRWTSGMWGIRGSFWCLAALTAIVCGGGSLVMPLPPAGPKGAKAGLAPRQVLVSRDYRWLTAAVALATPAVLLFSPRIVEMGQQRGLEQHAAIWAVALGAACNAAGRLTCPAVSDRLGRRRTARLLLWGLAGLSVAFAFARGWWFLAGYGALCFFYSGQAALLPSFVTDLFGPGWAGVNYGLTALGMTAGSLAFPLALELAGGDWPRHLTAALAAAAGTFCYRRLPEKEKH